MLGEGRMKSEGIEQKTKQLAPGVGGVKKFGEQVFSHLKFRRN